MKKKLFYADTDTDIEESGDKDGDGDGGKVGKPATEQT